MIADGEVGRGSEAQAAADWVVRLSDAACSEADWLAFAAWLDSAPARCGTPLFPPPFQRM